VCEGTLVPHWAHLFNCGACQRWLALRVRNRIFEVLRFGTPMVGGKGSTLSWKDNVETLKR
jgi:hypothetical protein